MDLTITLGWWLVPAAGTVAAFASAYLTSPSRRPPQGYGNIADALISLLMYGAAAILSLICWLIWAVLT